jgi:hypothetical protein
VIAVRNYIKKCKLVFSLSFRYLARPSFETRIAHKTDMEKISTKSSWMIPRLLYFLSGLYYRLVKVSNYKTWVPAPRLALKLYFKMWLQTETTSKNANLFSLCGFSIFAWGSFETRITHKTDMETISTKSFWMIPF